MEISCEGPWRSQRHCLLVYSRRVTRGVEGLAKLTPGPQVPRGRRVLPPVTRGLVLGVSSLAFPRSLSLGEECTAEGPLEGGEHRGHALCPSRSARGKCWLPVPVGRAVVRNSLSSSLRSRTGCTCEAAKRGLGPPSGLALVQSCHQSQGRPP